MPYVLTRGAILLDERASEDGEDTLDEWFALKIPRMWWGCGEVREHICESECPHRIVVWPEEDDPNLLRVMNEHAKREPTEIVPYEKALGDCVSWYFCAPS